MTRRQGSLFPDMPPTKKYVADFPELVAEWHPERNEGLSPEDITCGSGKKVWWLCSNGHEWLAVINTRPKNGCPYCSNRYASKGSSLLDLNPTVCEQWDYERNDRKPSEYNPKSGKKVWWRCLKGSDHRWKAAIHSRTKEKDGVLSGCPFCAGRKPSRDYNFAVAHPELLGEWDYDKNKKAPEDYVPKSNYSVWWKCIKGHTWESKINNRANGRGCPHCNIKSSRPEIRILTELMSCFQNVSSRTKVEGFEVDIYLPDLRVGIEYDGSYWHADKHRYDIKKQRALEAKDIRLIRVREKPLSKISSEDLIVERAVELTKETVNALMSLISPNDPLVTFYLGQKQWMNDELYVNYLDNFPSPLPENSLAVSNPNLSSEWHHSKNSPLLPKNFTPNSGQKVWWLCPKGHEWEASIDARNNSRRPSGCPYCSPTRKLASTKNNMAVTNPKMAAMFHPTKNGNDSPEKLVEGTGKVLWWKCENGHEWKQRGYTVVKIKGHPCPICRKLEQKL